jgi:hypothetical protein
MQLQAKRPVRGCSYFGSKRMYELMERCIKTVRFAQSNKQIILSHSHLQTTFFSVNLNPKVRF